MENIRSFHTKAIGESHKIKDIPCQDAAGSYEDGEKGIYIAAISDGHGNEKHFMSQHGSDILIRITLDTIKSFLDIDVSSILSVEYSASEVLGAKDDNTQPEQFKEKKNKEQNRVILKLISSIISKWNTEIESDWKKQAPTKDLMIEKNVPSDLIEDYLNERNLEYAYGCTLLAFALTRDFWLAFQIGDGYCITFLDNGDVFYPIPADKRFTGSTTASMCNSDALENFRYCYGNTKTPFAVFVGSDGLDGVFGTLVEYSLPRLEQLYENIVKMFKNHGFDNTIKEIEKSLPELSAKGVTRDDMSLAGIINFAKLETSYPFLLENEITKLKKEIENIENEYQKSCTSYEEKQREISDKRKEREDLNREIQELNKRVLKIDSEMQKQKQTAASINKEVDIKNSKLEEIDESINKIKEILNTSKSQVDKVDQKKNSLENKLKTLISEFDQISYSKEICNYTEGINTVKNSLKT